MKWISQFGRFWYDFIVGDDWTIAAAVVVFVGITYAAAHNGVTAWPFMPIAVAAILSASLWRVSRAARAGQPRPDASPPGGETDQ
jgi:hypothetical protein